LIFLLTFRGVVFVAIANPKTPRVKKNLLVFVFLFFFAQIKAQQPAPVALKSPSITLETDTFNFGTVKQGTLVEHDFKFTNTGEVPVTLLYRGTSCSCAHVEHPREPIAPGKSGVLHFILDTRGTINLQDKTGLFEINGTTERITLHMIGKVVAPVELNLPAAPALPPPDPSAPVMTFDSTTYDFGEVVQGTRIEKKFRFTNTGKSPLIIQSALGSGATYANYPKEPIAPGKSGIISVLFPTEGKIGIQDKTTTIESNNRDGLIVLHLKGKVIPRSPPSNVPVIVIRPPEPNAPPDPSAPVITFDSTTINFGEVVTGTFIRKEFHFKNTGRSPLIIQTVSCPDPVVPDYSREPIAPGKSGIITLRFSTQGRMGPQHRTATVQSNNRDGNIVLYLKGTVMPGPVTVEEKEELGQKEFKYADRPIMTFKTTEFDFGTMIMGGIVRKDFEFTNTGKSPLVITDVGRTAVSRIYFPSDPILPGQKGVITIIISAKRYGACRGWSRIDYNNTADDSVVLRVFGKVISDTMKNKSIRFDTIHFNYGEVAEGAIVEHRFYFTNNGKKTVRISSCVTDCDYAVAGYPKEAIRPGQSGAIKFTLNATGKHGVQQNLICICCTDGSIIVLRLFGNIIPAPPPH
jgi:hypothetical protein